MFLTWCYKFLFDICIFFAVMDFVRFQKTDQLPNHNRLMCINLCRPHQPQHKVWVITLWTIVFHVFCLHSDVLLLFQLLHFWKCCSLWNINTNPNPTRIVLRVPVFKYHPNFEREAFLQWISCRQKCPIITLGAKLCKSTLFVSSSFDILIIYNTILITVLQLIATQHV